MRKGEVSQVPSSIFPVVIDTVIKKQAILYRNTNVVCTEIIRKFDFFYPLRLKEDLYKQRLYIN